MDIEYTPHTPSQTALFKPIEHFPIDHLYLQNIILENTFSESYSTTSQTILLTFIDNTLLLSNPQAFNIQPYAGVNLDFDLKFEVIYQT